MFFRVLADPVLCQNGRDGGKVTLGKVGTLPDLLPTKLQWEQGCLSSVAQCARHHLFLATL
jgi:hypothetical protein